MWHPDSDIDKPLQEFRMTVHAFGNCPSPAVATYDLRKAVQSASAAVRSFVANDFYVDDGLISCPSEQDAINLIKETQLKLLEGGNLRLHKITSNSTEVLRHFKATDLAKDLTNLDLSCEKLPLQRSLGVYWDINSDVFTFSLNQTFHPAWRLVYN